MKSDEGTGERSGKGGMDGENGGKGEVAWGKKGRKEVIVVG